MRDGYIAASFTAAMSTRAVIPATARAPGTVSGRLVPGLKSDSMTKMALAPAMAINEKLLIGMTK